MRRRFLVGWALCAAVGCSSSRSAPTAPAPSTPTAFTTAARVIDVITGASLSGVTATGDGVGGSASSAAGTMTVGATDNSVSIRAVAFARGGYVTRTVAMKIPGDEVVVSMIPTSFNLEAYDQLLRSPRLQRWTAAPPLVVQSRTVQFTSVEQVDAVAIDDVMSDSERSGLEADLAWALPQLTGNTYPEFAGITRETMAVGARMPVLNTGVITVARYAGLSSATTYAAYSRWEYRTDGTVIGGTIMLDRDFDRSASVVRRTVRAHELGHALGYTHVTLLASVMNETAVREPTTFDRQATQIAFRRPPGNVRLDSDPSSASLNRLSGAVWSRGEGLRRR